MGSYLLRRVLATIPVVWGVVTIVFLLLHLVPGDPVDLILGDTAMPAQRTELREKLHLDDPLPVQYGRYIRGLVSGDLGTSIWNGEPVVDRIARAFPSTVFLALCALSVALLISIPAGIVAAVKRDTALDWSAMAISLIGLSMPTFWLGPIFILLFAVGLDWFPISGRENLASVVLPALTLGSGMAALLARMTRASFVEILEEPFIRTAWAKGLSAWRVLGKHALRNALIPIVTIVGLQAGSLLSGSVITEKIFSWPGIGLELIEAIEHRDYPVVQGCVAVIALSYVAINLLTDLAYVWIDPRIRVSKAEGE